MASAQEVRKYLAYWFQLGKHIVIRNGQESLLPQPVIQGDRYTQAFEDCWQQITSPNAGDCYLEGTEETVAELLTPGWIVTPCARCYMPVPVVNIGVPSLSCPCNDIPNWPNTELPAPRSPVNSQTQLKTIHDRLLSNNKSTS
jgi:hypothetical protein